MQMSTLLKAALVLVALTGAPAGYIFYQAVLSPDAWKYNGGQAWNWTDMGLYHAAPGPIVGAGLPFLALGLGAYWLVTRARRRAG
jgi:hypothetical protein